LYKRNTIYFIDNQVPISRINSEWQLISAILYEIFKNIGLGVKIISNEYNVQSLDYAQRIIYSAEINKKLFDLIGFIKHRDILIFTDARSSLIHDVYEYFILKGIRPYIIGIWHDGYWNGSSIYKKMYQKRNISYSPIEYERMLAKIFDLNLITNPVQYSYFKTQVSAKSKFVNLPFALLKDAYAATELSDIYSTKLDTILINSNDILGKDTVLKNKYDIMVKELSEFDIFDISVIKTHNLKVNLPAFGKSKIMINLNSMTTSPVEIFHCLQLGILTITVENKYLTDIGYPEELLLEKHEVNTEKLYKFIRYCSTINEKLQIANERYTELLEQTKQILEPEYSAEPFLKLIKNVKNRK